MKQDKEKDKNAVNRMKEDVNETSRTMKPGDKLKNSSTSSQSNATPPTAGSTGGGITNIRSGKGAEENSDQKY